MVDTCSDTEYYSVYTGVYSGCPWLQMILAPGTVYSVLQWNSEKVWYGGIMWLKTSMSVIYYGFRLLCQWYIVVQWYNVTAKHFDP